MPIRSAATFLRNGMKEQGDITMPELAAKLEAECKVTVHSASLSRFLIARGFTVKKN